MARTLERIIRTGLFAGALASLSGCYNPFAYNFPDKNCYIGYREDADAPNATSGLFYSSTGHIDCNETAISPNKKRVAFVNLTVQSRAFKINQQTGEDSYSNKCRYGVHTADRNGDNEIFVTAGEFNLDALNDNKYAHDKERCNVDLNWVDDEHIVFKVRRKGVPNPKRQIFYAAACRNGKTKEINFDFDVDKIELSADRKSLKVYSGYKTHSIDTAELPSGKVHPILMSDLEVTKRKK